MTLVALSVFAASGAAGREVIGLNLDWVYHRGAPDGDASAARYDGSDWEPVALPHTYRLTSINLDDCADDSTQPTFHRDVCWYRRRLRVEVPPGGRALLEFEGAHQVTDLWVNGRRVGRHATGGYTPFHFDVTEFVRPVDDNVIALRLDNRVNEEVPPDGSMRDYVLFGGLYRDVRLVVTDALRVTFPWEAREAGVRVTTPSVSRDSATVTVETSVQNTADEARSCRVVTRIADMTGRVVEKLVSSEVTIEPDRTRTFVQTGGVHEELRLWSPDDPYLYRVHSEVVSGAATVDRVVTPLGLRWFEYRPGVGLLINGEPIELIGANRHQQYPYVGDAVPNNLHRSDAIKFKRSGVNVVRLAHYPHDDAFLEACDELGLIVLEEPPTWIDFGPPVWMDRLERALRVMIRSHRNHPCVWGWGGGINHRGPVRRLQYAAKEEDPTRVTISNSTLWTGPTHSGEADVYGVMDYRGARVPEGEPLFCIEHGGSVDTTGHQRIVSRYRADPARIGLALWSAHDGFSFKKRGEELPNLSVWRAALWDPFRIPKPAYFWYRSELLGEPIVHIADDRAQSEGTVTVFSNCDEVELYVDGVSVGRRAATAEPGVEHLKSPPVCFPVVWSDGEARAVGYVGGAATVEGFARKPGEPHHLRVEFDADTVPVGADGSSIVMAYASVCDRRGAVVTADTPPVTFGVSGPAEIVGDERIGANPVVWRRGVAPVMLRVGREPGEIVLTADAEGFDAASASLRLPSTAGDGGVPEPFEPLRVRVDLGGTEQHVQEGWTAWRHEAGAARRTLATVAGEVTLSLGPKLGRPLEWTSRWGVPGDLCYLIEDGVLTDGGVELTISGLPAGEYRFRSWHHRVASERADAPPISATVSDGRGEARPVLDGFLPTFGSKIRVSEDGDGEAGDGGSNLGAEGFAEFTLRAERGRVVTITVTPTGDGGALAWNGFEIAAVGD